ncbi:hypothetical protein FCK19_13415 [Salmonella enterica]|nr:hypothetical protein [Salmonella enterica]EJF4692086.1 hypothetical protein [Salmonella enterica]EJF5296185.1 hypothetical protein [Salmonella enterica]
MALEKGIAQRVEAFIASGRPSVCGQSIDDRRTGYIASTALAGGTESRVEVDEFVLEGMTFRVFSPRHASSALPCVIYYHGGCLFERLTAQGINCTCQHYLGVIHRFFQPGGVSQSARSAIQDIAWRVGQ